MNRFDPLEKRRIIFFDCNRQQKSLSLISKEFNLHHDFNQYYEPELNKLNQNTVVITKWINDLKLFESSLNLVLNLPYYRFWSVIVFNDDFHKSLESYLTMATRPYRLHPMIKYDTIVPVMTSIHQIIFRIYTRILLSKESEENYMTIDYHSQLLLKHNRINIIILFDLIQLYSYGEHYQMLKYLLQKFFNQNYSQMVDQIKFLLTEIMQFFDNFQPLSNENVENYDELSLIIANIVDVLFALNKMTMIEPRICSLIAKPKSPTSSTIAEDQSPLKSLIKFFTIYIPFVEEKIQRLIDSNVIVENFYNFFRCQICLSKSCSLLLFHRTLTNVYIEPLIHSEEDGQDEYETFENLIRLLEYLCDYKRFCHEFFRLFSFDSLFGQLSDKYENIFDYYREKLDASSTVDDDESANTRPPQQDRPNKLTNDISNENSNIIQYDYRQDVETLEKEKLIAEMFPDYGDGFIYKCLEYFDFNNERVVDAILESNLPEDLMAMDRKLTKSDLNKVKQLESANRRTTISNDYEKFNENDKINYKLSDIHIGKRDRLNNNTSDDKEKIKELTLKLQEKQQSENEEMKQQIATMIEKGKLTREDLRNNIEYVGIYDDEYDDTYENTYDDQFDVEPLNDDIDEGDGDEDDQGGNNAEDQDSAQDSVTDGDRQPPKQFANRTSNEKYENCKKYFRKQLYSKQQYNRRQNHSNQSNNNNQNQSNQRASKQQRNDSNNSNRNMNRNRFNNNNDNSNRFTNNRK